MYTNTYTYTHTITHRKHTHIPRQKAHTPHIHRKHALGDIHVHTSKIHGKKITNIYTQNRTHTDLLTTHTHKHNQRHTRHTNTQYLHILTYKYRDTDTKKHQVDDDPLTGR